MSSGARRAADEVGPVARRIRDALAPACERACVAGSLRRRARAVSDIEIVCEPRRDEDLFGAPSGECQLAALLDRLRAAGSIRWRIETHPAPKDWRAARRMWAAVVLPEEIPLDVFAVRPPAQWGAILAIRTGPAEYSRRLVTSCRTRGLRCEDGRLVDAQNRPVETPEERDFIEACGMQWVHPEART